jgi:hypothetical protein
MGSDAENRTWPASAPPLLNAVGLVAADGSRAHGLRYVGIQRADIRYAWTIEPDAEGRYHVLRLVDGPVDWEVKDDRSTATEAEARDAVENATVRAGAPTRQGRS